MEKQNGLKKFEIANNLYNSVWSSIRSWHRGMIECIAILVTVTAVMAYALACNKHVFLATIVSQLAFIWIILVIIEAGHNYRTLQAISSNIERKYACGLQEILPPSFLRPGHNLPEVYKVHFIAFGIYFSFLPWVYVHWARTTDCPVELDVALRLGVAGIILALLLSALHFSLMSKLKDIFVCIFAPFLIVAAAALAILGLRELPARTIEVFGLWAIGLVLFYAYHRSRREKFNEFCECTKLKEKIDIQCPEDDDKKDCQSSELNTSGR